MKILLTGIVCFLLSTLSYAQDQADSGTEEVIVIAELSKAQVEEQIVEIQTEIYRMFNASNSSNKFDYHCRTETPTGTHFTRQVCEPTFVTDALQRNAEDSVRGFDIQLSRRVIESQLEKEYEQLNTEFAILYEKEPAFAEVMNILSILTARLEEL